MAKFCNPALMPGRLAWAAKAWLGNALFAALMASASLGMALGALALSPWIGSWTAALPTVAALDTRLATPEQWRLLALATNSKCLTQALSRTRADGLAYIQPRCVKDALGDGAWAARTGERPRERESLDALALAAIALSQATEVEIDRGLLRQAMEPVALLSKNWASTPQGAAAQSPEALIRALNAGAMSFGVAGLALTLGALAFFARNRLDEATRDVQARHSRQEAIDEFALAQLALARTQELGRKPARAAARTPASPM